MLGKLVQEIAKAAGEVVAAPLTAANAATKAVSREADKLLDDREPPKK